MEKEVWKAVENYDGYYEVSTLGRVKSLTRYVPHSTIGSKLVTGGILAQCLQATGYLTTCLCKDNKPKSMLVHRLVAKAFCEGYQENYDVNHKDGNKQNNLATNLEWVTRQQNIQHSFDNKLQINLRGEHDSQSKFYEITYPNGDVKIIKGLADWCLINNLSRREFYRILSGERLDYIGYKIRREYES